MLGGGDQDGRLAIKQVIMRIGGMEFDRLRRGRRNEEQRKSQIRMVFDMTSPFSRFG